MSLVDVSLDALSHTGTLHAQTVLHAIRQAVLDALLGLGQQVLDTVLARHLDQLRLPALRVHGILPDAGCGVLVDLEGVRAGLLVLCRGVALGDDGGGRPAGEEALQRGRQRLGQLDEVLRARSHGAGGVSVGGR